MKEETEKETRIAQKNLNYIQLDIKVKYWSTTQLQSILNMNEQ